MKRARNAQILRGKETAATFYPPLPTLDELSAELNAKKKAHGSTEGSTKFDGDKPMMDLVPLSSVYAVSQVLTFGAKKYSANGWQDVPDARNRYNAAMLRHMTLVQDGEELDEDSGLPHADHIACNAMFLSWFRRNPERGL